MDNPSFQRKERRPSNVIIPPRNDEPTARKVRENQLTSSIDSVARVFLLLAVLLFLIGAWMMWR